MRNMRNFWTRFLAASETTELLRITVEFGKSASLVPSVSAFSSSESLEAGLSTIPPFFNHIYPILTYLRRENSLSKHGKVIAGGRGRGCAFGRVIQEEKLAPQGEHQEKDRQHQLHHKLMILPTALLQKMTGYNVTESSAGTRTPV